MRGKIGDIFTTIRTEGALLPAEILRRIVEGDHKLEGLDPESYHLEKSEKINEAVNRAWFRCLGAWRTFRAAAEKLSDSDTGTTLTRERWLLILFQELGYGRLLAAKAQAIGGNTYPISHLWHHTPIHLVSFRQDLDRRTPGVAGASRLSPHSLVQEFLNRSENHLWGVVSNGHRLRILRDNISLTRQAYIDFDLEALMEGEIYPDFVLLYLLLHQSRLEADKPEECRLEQWSREAQERGTRALDRLRDGVEQAITALGQGFLAHPENTALRRTLQSGTLSPLGYYQQLLRLIYRFIFLFVAEDRGLIPLLDISADVRKRYAFYAIARLRRLAGRRRGTRHGDLYAGLRVTFACLEKGEPSLGIPALNGFLFSPETLPDLNGCKLANDALLSAIRGLCYTEENHILRPVDYRNLGTEELGSVYESLLELHPELNVDAFTFALKTYAGSERKTTGSYYTHPSLIRCLLDSALEPLLDEAMKKPDSEEALLSLKVVDPACGSGHFLIAAAHRIAKDLAVVRTGEGEPPLEALREALRDVVANCIYGVDINPLAVELCKVALWLESLDPRKPLGFLDHRIKCGNSIIGATPELLKEGIPDDAFKPVEGDDPAVASSIRRKNKEERKGQQDLFMIQEDRSDWREAASAYATWASLPEDNIKQVSEKTRQYDTLLDGHAIRHQHDLADLWTAAFFWPLTKETYDTVPTQDIFRRLRDGAYALTGKTAGRVKALANEHRFFHWHLEFPEVFMKRQGFDCVLGNPPWERIKLQEKEFFAQRDPEIANAPNAAARKRLIADLPETNPALWKAFASAKRTAEGESHFLRMSGRYPLCAVGDINTYQIFAGLARELLSSEAYAGIVVPSGIATDDTTKFFFRDMMDSRSLHSLYMFENEGKLFPSIDHRNKFALLTISGLKVKSQEVDIVFGVNAVEELMEKERHFTLTAEDILLLNPNTRTCPIFRSKRDAEITKAIYRRVPVLIDESKGEMGNPWGIKFSTMFHMANDSHLFHIREQLEQEGFTLNRNVFKRGERTYLPLYEGKMFWHFDHRFGTYEEQTEAQANQGKLPELSPEQHRNPDFYSLSRYWVDENDVKARIPRRPKLLASAMELPEPSRTEAVIKCFSYWAAGYYRKVGDEKKAEQLIALALRSSTTDTQVDVLNQWLLDEHCQRMQERFPLTATDVQRMAVINSNSIPLAEELIERFSPHWFVTFRDVTTAVVLRTAVFSIIPKVAVGHKAPLVFIDGRLDDACCFLATVNSLVFDYVARQSVGGSSMGYFILKQLPVLPPLSYTSPVSWGRLCLRSWLMARVLELSHTAWDMDPLSSDWGDTMPPFIWREDRRSLIRAELDAAFFHLYLGNEKDWRKNGSEELLAYFPTPRHAVEHIMDSFRILRERDAAAYGTYRTKDTIIEIYDEMAVVMEANTGALAAGHDATSRYQTRLNPPPGPPPTAYGSFISMYQLDRANWPTHIHPPHPDWDESIIDAWFNVCRRQWNYLEEDQIFPWDSRETFIYALIPYLIQEKPGAEFEFYRDAASLASCPERLETLLLDDNLRNEYRQLMFDSEWMRFPKNRRIRPRLIRETLQNKQIIQTAADSGTTTIHSSCSLPPLPSGLKPLLPLILKAAVNLDKLQRHTLEDAEAAKITFTQDEITNELKALSAA